MPSGVGDVVSDFVEIDFNVMSHFLQQVATRTNFENRSIKLLLRGVVVHLLALLSCKSVPIEVESLYPLEWIEEATTLFRANMQSIASGNGNGDASR
jgi:hypothetical protein